jgi:hypothetical protein
MLKILTSLLPKHIHGFNVDGTRDARFENLTIAKLLGVMTRKEKRQQRVMLKSRQIEYGRPRYRETENEE